MGASTNDRVRKHRDKVKSTDKGIEDLRAKNRVYAARSRAKKEIKRLTEEKTKARVVLDFVEQQEVDHKVQAFKETVKIKSKYFDLGEDEQRKLDVKFLRYELKVVRKLAKEDLMDTVGALLNLRNVVGGELKN